MVVRRITTSYGDLPLEVTPLEARGQLGGFLLVGRWPKDTTEWAQFLLLAVQVAAAPGMLPGLPHLGLTHRAAWIEQTAPGGSPASPAASAWTRCRTPTPRCCPP